MRLAKLSLHLSVLLTYIFNKLIRQAMKNKLTLRLDESLINLAKKHAREKGTSVSQMVADYFSLLESNQTREIQQLPPITSSLTGILRTKDVEEEEYRRYLEEKHLK